MRGLVPRCRSARLTDECAMTQPNTETDVIDPILHLDCGLLREGISPDANAVMF